MNPRLIVLASKNIRNRGIRSWLTMIGIFIGVAAVVALISMGQGLQAAVTGQFAALDPDKLIVTNVDTGFGPPGSTAVKKLNEHDKELIESVNGVDVVVQRLIRTVSFEYNDKTDFKYVANIPTEKEAIEVIYDALNLELEKGRLLDENDRRKVILGHNYLSDDFGKSIRVGKKVIIQGEEFEVIGFLKKTSTFILNGIIIMPDEDLREILNIGDEFDILVVQVKDRNKLPDIKDILEKKIRKDRDLDEGEDDFSIQTPEQSIQTINTILDTINLVIVGIAAISLLVGGIGITNTMYTSVLERIKEIGIMKSVGAKNSDILTLFLAESALLGLVGGIIGVIIGLALAYAAASGISTAFGGLEFSISLNVPFLIFAALFSVFVGTISGVFPALQASKLNPVDALRS
jgi:putative ABC transport system permease protein